MIIILLNSVFGHTASYIASGVFKPSASSFSEPAWPRLVNRAGGDAGFVDMQLDMSVVGTKVAILLSC
jgi:hypothetical protein